MRKLFLIITIIAVSMTFFFSNFAFSDSDQDKLGCVYQCFENYYGDEEHPNGKKWKDLYFDKFSKNYRMGKVKFTATSGFEKVCTCEHFCGFCWWISPDY